MGRRPLAGSLLALGLLALRAQSIRADEGGVSFWTPGQYGSFAAIAPSPGWSLPLMFYNYGGSIDASGPLTRWDGAFFRRTKESLLITVRPNTLLEFLQPG